jgi:hypothetical protein
MSKVKVKKIKVPVGVKDEGLAEMFNQMLGTGSVNITIAYPRYKKIKEICLQLIKLFEILSTCPFIIRQPQFAPHLKQLQTFCAESKERCAKIFCIDFTDYEWNLTTVEDELKKKFTEVYDAAKKDDLVRKFVIMCDNLVPYKKYFAEEDKFNHKFIHNMAGAEWCPFPFVNLNIKQIFNMSEVKENTILFFMTILHKAYTLSRKLYDELQSPDVDVDQFVEIIMSNINEIQKRPELHRCREAFQKIKDSVGLLKNNFNGYYRDFIGTNDSTIMMQHFIIDVSKKTEASATVTAQFRTIIKYYQKLSQDQEMNPKVKMLFDKVNESFKALEKNTENLVNINDDDNTSQTSEEDSVLLQPRVTSTAKSVDDLMREDTEQAIFGGEEKK